MEIPKDFTGLGMPVFTAFGWAGEETALNYAFSQLEGFVTNLHAKLSRSLREELPYFGLSIENQNVFLAAAEEIDSNVHILFNARPTSLELQLVLTNKEVLLNGLKEINKDLEGFRQLLQGLDPNWILRVQQVHVNEETGDQGHYQDLFKESVSALEPEAGIEMLQKVAYLNEDDKWITPIYLSQRTSAEQIAAMQKQVVEVMAERLDVLAPLILILQGKSAKKAAKTAKQKKKKKDTPKPVITVPTTLEIQKTPSTESFSYITELKPLHLRRGFVNMESVHWPFFAINARTESREVTVLTSTLRDENCSVWRLQPNDRARLVLSSKAHTWLEDHFVADDMIRLTATKAENGDIEIRLEEVE